MQGVSGFFRAAFLMVTILATPAGGAPTEHPFFADRTESAGLDFEYFNGMSGELYFAEVIGGGAALLDYDGDGDLDLFLTQGEMLGDKPLSEATHPPRGPLPLGDRLLRNDLVLDAEGRPSPRLVDVTATAGIAPGGFGMGVASADYDGDGWADLYVTNLGANRMLKNRGDGSFADATAASGTGDTGWGVPAVFFDFDGDGHLDLFVGNYVEYRLAIDKECKSRTGAVDYCSPAAYRPAPDRLFRNAGDGSFSEWTRRAGLAAAYGAGLGAVTGDFNADGVLDLYVANDGVPNQLWVNKGDGTFFDDSLITGTAVNAEGASEASMGVVAVDFTGDGAEDLFMGHLAGETNTLYVNSGDGFFEDMSTTSGLGLSSWQATGFGVAATDFDHDGFLDLFIANGAVTRIEERARLRDPYPLDQKDQLFRGLGGGRFVERTESEEPVLAPLAVGRGVAVGDLDGDGDEDLVEVNSAGPARLLDNQAGAPAPWAGVIARVASAEVLGATARLTAESGRVTHRRLRTDGSYASARSPWLHFGLAGETDLTSIELDGPGGRVRFLGPPAGRYLVLAEER